MGFISGTFKRVLIFILAVILFLAEFFTVTLYVLDSSTQDEILYEIIRNIDLRDLINDSSKPNSGSSKNADLDSAIDDLKKSDTSGNLDGIEDADDFMSALSKTHVLKEYIKSIAFSFITGGFVGNPADRISLTALQEAIIDAVAELTGKDADSSAEFREFANNVADQYFSKIFDYIVDIVGTETLIEYLGDEDDRIETLKFLMSEKTRRVSVAICAAIAVLLFFICKGTGLWCLSAGISTFLAGGIFLFSGLGSSFVIRLIDKTSYYYLSSLVPILKDTAVKLGGVVFVAGIFLILLYNVVFKKKNNS